MGEDEFRDVKALLVVKSEGVGRLPWGPVVKTWYIPCRGHGFIPWSGSQDCKLCGVAKKKILSRSQIT